MFLNIYHVVKQKSDNTCRPAAANFMDLVIIKKNIPLILS